jgi:hypothetical protein
VAFIGDENTSRAPTNLEWMEQRMAKRRLFKQTTSLKERLAEEATLLRNTPPGFERELLVRKARRSEAASLCRVADLCSQAPR